MGTRTGLGMFLRASKARSIFIGVRGWRENDWKDATCGSYCGTSWWNTLILLNQLHFLITFIWDALNVNVNFNPMLQATSSSRCHKRWSAVLLQSRLDEKWWADSMECFGYLRHVEDPEVWTRIGKAAQKREKLKCAIETQKFDNARRLRGIYFINREDDEYKETIKNAWRKLEVPKDAAMSCKEGTNTARRFRKLKRKVVNPTILETTSGIISTERSWRLHRSDQHDQYGQKTYGDTRVLNPQSFSWLVVRQNQIGHPRSKSTILTPKTKSETRQSKENSHVMIGTIFFVCSASWISRCLLASIFFRTESTAPCRREVRKEETEEEFVVAKSKSVNMVPRNQLSAGQNLFFRFACLTRPSETRVGSKFCFRESWARQGPEPTNELSRVAKRWQSVSSEHNTRKLVRSAFRK